MMFSSPSSLRIGLLAGLFEGVFLGLFTVLFIFAGYNLLYVRPASRLRYVLFSVSVVMYAASVSNWAIYVHTLSKSASLAVTDQALRWELTIAEELIATYLPYINYVFSDAIVVWRAWIISDRRTIVFIPPCIFLLATVGSCLANTVYAYRYVSSGNASAGILSTGVCFWALTILTNVWATAAVGIRAWGHRRFVKEQLGKGTARSKAEKMLILLVESGAFYVCIWVAYLPVYFASSETGKPIFDAIIVQLAGIYPTLIITLTSIRSNLVKEEDTPFNIRSDIVFASVGQPTGTTMGLESSGTLDTDVGKANNQSERIV